MNCNSARQVIQIFVFGNKGTLVLKQGVISTSGRGKYEINAQFILLGKKVMWAWLNEYVIYMCVYI